MNWQFRQRLRGPAVGMILILLAGCDIGQSRPVDVGLFEPHMFNDLPYNVSFTSTNPIEDAALLAQGFSASREIAVFRMSGEPFGTNDGAEAAAVAAAFCVGGPFVFVPGADGILGDDAGYVFSHSCLVREE